MSTTQEMMTLIVMNFDKTLGDMKETSRREILTTKKGRWIKAGMLTFSAETLEQTKTNKSGSHWGYRLEPIA
jgi:hypothetical protein